MSFYPQAPKKENALDLIGLPIHHIGVEELHRFIVSVIDQKQKALVLNLNIHGANLAVKHSWFKELLHKSQVVFCDGEGVRWGMALLGENPPPKITYDRWMWELSALCEAKGYSMFLMGSAPGIAEEAAARLKGRFPGLKIAGTQHGFFAKEGPETEKVISEINRVKPDILLVGFGMPIQEKWLKDHWDRIDSHIFLTGGAALECVSGKLSPPPAWFVKTGLEWFFRWLQQPVRRFQRYFIGIPVFFFRVILYKLGKRR